MAARRPAHKLAHAQCPYGQANWADCDAAASHRWGRCKAEVSRKGSSEPGECSNWAVSDDGWCGQHFNALAEKELERARRAERKLQWDKAADEFIAKASDPNWEWWKGLSTSAMSTRGLQGVGAGQPLATHPTFSSAKASSAAPRPRKVPHRITLRKPPHRLTELA